jgi:glycopeptide antibiotics resistance protein
MPVRQKRLLIALFSLYLVLLVWGVLWKFTVPWIGAAAGLPHPIKLIPFVPDGIADASAPQEVIANVLLFVPFGIYLGLLAPRWPWWAVGAVVFGTSLVFEVTQPLISTGGFDTSDLIANTAGGIAGTGLLVLLRRRLGARLETIITRVLIVGTVVWVVALAVFIASPLRYAPQHDVVVQP